MEINFINLKNEKEWIEVVDAEVKLTDSELKHLLETPDYRFDLHANMRHIDHIIIKKENEEKQIIFPRRDDVLRGRKSKGGKRK